jgi:hypothetical protein
MSGVGTPWRRSRWSFGSFLLLDRNCKQCSSVVYDGDCRERWIHQKVYIARLKLLDTAGCLAELQLVVSCVPAPPSQTMGAQMEASSPCCWKSFSKNDAIERSKPTSKSYSLTQLRKVISVRKKQCHRFTPSCPSPKRPAVVGLQTVSLVTSPSLSCHWQIFPF